MLPVMGLLFFTFRPGSEGPIVIYLVDTLRPDRMSAYGAASDTTPAARALAREAVTYLNAHSVSTWTRPSVATLLTSLLPSGAAALNRWGRLDESVWYLPQVLQKKGWTTAGFISNGNVLDDKLGFQRGFDTFRAILSAKTGVFDATGREVVDPAVKFIQKQSSGRFFLYLHVVDPHIPYRVEPAYRSLFSHDASRSPKIPVDYDRSIRQADDQFAKIVEALRSRGFWDKATVVYTSDHGEEFYEHGDTGHGQTLYEEQIRIPLLIKYPDGRAAGTVSREPVTLADVAPTVAQLHGLPGSPHWIGSDLGNGNLSDNRELYFSEDSDAHRLYAIKRGSSKLIVRLYPQFSRALFALDRDPGEQNGNDLPCGNDGPDPALATALEKRRLADARAFPALRYDGESSRDRCQVTIDVSHIAKPFLRAEDHCRWQGAVAGGRLSLRQASGELLISADDTGRLPRAAFPPGGSGCALESIASRLLKGPLTEDYLQRLRAVGYVQ